LLDRHPSTIEREIVHNGLPATIHRPVAQARWLLSGLLGHFLAFLGEGMRR
jgi:hypothetical protein